MYHKSLDYYSALLNVLSYSLEHDEIEEIVGFQLAGDYWINIIIELTTLEVGKKDYNNFLVRQNKAAINSYIAFVNDTIGSIIKAEEDRELSNQEKRDNIKYGRKAYRLSWVAIAVSIVAVLSEMLITICTK